MTLTAVKRIRTTVPTQNRMRDHVRRRPAAAHDEVAFDQTRDTTVLVPIRSARKSMDPIKGN